MVGFIHGILYGDMGKVCLSWINSCDIWAGGYQKWLEGEYCN